MADQQETHQRQQQIRHYLARGWRLFPQHYPLGRSDPQYAQGIECSCGDPNCSQVGKHPMADSRDGKHEMVRNGFHGASLDEREVLRWLAIEPRMNLGVATGAVSGIVVLDFDRAQGQRDFEELALRHGPWPDGPSVRTGNGMHLYFAYPEGVENVPTLAKVLAPGTDIRADGGCATLPPSVHSSFRPYYWMRGPALPLPPLPEWVLEQLEQRQRERQERMAERARQMQDPSSFTLQEKLRQCETFLRGVKPAIEGQGGDAQTFYAACAGGDFDLTPAEFYPLLSAWNQRCVPPWDERGLRDKIANAERYRTEPRGIRLHHREAPRVPQAPPPAHEARRDSGHRPNQAEAGAREAPLGIAFRPDDLEPPDVDLLLKDFLDDEYLAGTLAIDGHPLIVPGPNQLRHIVCQLHVRGQDVELRNRPGLETFLLRSELLFLQIHRLRLHVDQGSVYQNGVHIFANLQNHPVNRVPKEKHRLAFRHSCGPGA